jgi:predicted O-methyltransferase YrrM
MNKGITLHGVFKPDSPREDRNFIFDYLPKNGTYIEIGVAEGTFSQTILDKLNPKKIYLIDPYREGLEFPDFLKNNYGVTPIYYDEFHNAVKERFSEYNNTELLRMTSDEAIDKFEDNSFDFIYIDGGHNYNQVSKDLKNYFPKIKKGGFLIGDDYDYPGYQWGLDIKKAVDEFILEKKEELELIKIKNLQYVIRKKLI